MDGDAGLSRREALGAGAGAGGFALAGGAIARAGGSPGGSAQGVAIDEATNVAIAASPDGRRLAVDLLGILWTLPVEGGPLARLTGDFDDIAQPDWSPAGDRIAYQSYRGGQFHIWSIAATGGAPIRLTDGAHDDREPRWSPDGCSIAFSSDRTGRYAIHVLDVATGAVRQLVTMDAQLSEPCWSPDGGRIAFVADATRVMVVPAAGGTSVVAAAIAASADPFHPARLLAPSFAPDGTLCHVHADAASTTLVHGGADLVAGEDLYPFRPAWLPGGGFVYGAGGRLRRHADGGALTEVPFTARVPVRTPSYRRRKRDWDGTAARQVVGVVAPQLSPDGRRIAFCALNDLWVMTIGEAPRRLVTDPFHKCDPAWSPDGATIAYTTDCGGTLDLWLHDVASSQERQLTSLPDHGAVSPAWSRDGTLIAFLDQDGACFTVEVASGAVQKVYDALWEPGRPSFGPDGRTIAYAAFKPSSARFREGHSEVLTVDRQTGAGRYQPIAPGKSIGVRGLDGPVWSPDGTRLAYVFASTLWTVPVDASGMFVGPPRRITEEVTDAPSWSGDSRALLYLNNGRLRLVPAEGGAPRTIPLRLTWAAARPPGRLLIAGARVWDGVAQGYRDDADVLVAGHRIEALAQHGTVADGAARRIDGTGLTLMPGLVDMHTHRQMQGYNYGDRMGRVLLALGITATRSPGAPAYHMMEDREAIDSGARVAPRHFATGEAIDGGRIFYNFMRPVTEPGQMALELARAEALSYDMIKTYVRLPHDEQAAVIRAAHRTGVSVSSHYHYPALALGADAMEHMGATSRLGYSRTLTPLGAGYGDVQPVFAAAGAIRTTTLFLASVLLGEDDALARDARVRTLFPAWELRRLDARVAAMRGGDRAPLHASLARQVAQIRETMRLGGRVAAGTDAPIDLVGISLHLNLRAMVRHGITPLDALTTATRNAGEFLAEPIGRIASGMLADMILVAGDPLTRIEDAAATRVVIANGAVHTPETLMRPFTDRTSAMAQNVRLADLGSDDRYGWHGAAFVEEARAACCLDHGGCRGADA